VGIILSKPTSITLKTANKVDSDHFDKISVKRELYEKCNIYNIVSNTDNRL
jgi:hypothetical protein